MLVLENILYAAVTSSSKHQKFIIGHIKSYLLTWCFVFMNALLKSLYCEQKKENIFSSYIYRLDTVCYNCVHLCLTFCTVTFSVVEQ